MSRPRVLVVGGKAKNLEAARKAGCEVVHLQRVDAFTPRHRDACDEAILLDYTDLDTVVPVLRALHAARPLAYAVSFTESGLVPTGAIRDALGLPGPSARVSGLLRDKSAMRRALADHPLLGHPAVVAASAEEVLAFAAGAGPVVLKPVDGSGSRGIHRVDDLADVPAAVADLHAAGHERFLVERFLSGPEFSVEAISWRGAHRVLAVTEKFTSAHHVEIGHVVPARLAEADRVAIHELTHRFLDAVGVADGVTHTEVILSPGGPVVVESHDRVGGDRISDLVGVATGVHPVGTLFGLIAGTADWPPSGAPEAGGCAIWFLTPPAGRVGGIDGVEHAQGLPGVREVSVSAQPGDTVRAVRCSADRSGSVVATGADATEAVERARAAAAAVTFRMEHP